MLAETEGRAMGAVDFADAATWVEVRPEDPMTVLQFGVFTGAHWLARAGGGERLGVRFAGHFCNAINHGFEEPDLVVKARGVVADLRALETGLSESVHAHFQGLADRFFERILAGELAEEVEE